MIEESHNTIRQQNFIQIKEQLYSAKDKPPLFLKKLQEDVQFMKNIMDICFRPTYFQKQHNIILTPDLPALITDVLSSLYQDFIQLLACDKIQKQENELFGLENENQIPNVFDLEDNNKTQQFIMLKQIHLGILQNQPQQAALSYFNKIISRVFYHRPAQIMRFYEISPQIIKNIIQKMNNKIILQLFCKLLQIQSGKQFFKQYKLKYIKYYYKQLISIIQKNNTNTNTNNNTYNNTYNNNQLQTWLEGLLIIHKFLTDKMQEKIDFYKYLNIIIEINKLDFQILKIINNKIQNVGDNQLLLCLKWIQELLKNDGYIMGQPNIKLNLTILNRKNSISNNFYGDQSPSQSNKFHLTQQQLIQICKTIQHSICRYIYNKNQLQNKHNKSQNIIFIYRNLYFLLRIWINYKRQKHMTNKQLINDIVNESFMSKTYDIALQHPFNNSLHNYIKEFIVEALSSKIINPEYFYNAEETYKQIIFMNFPKKKYHKHQNTFYNKVYLIYKELITLYPLHSSMNQINALIKDQQERTSHLIGGDPRKLQTDTLRGSSNGISESSQSYDQFMQFDLCSNKSLGLNSTRTPVVKRSSLATFSEYADKVEAQQQYNKQQNISQQYD